MSRIRRVVAADGLSTEPHWEFCSAWQKWQDIRKTLAKDVQQPDGFRLLGRLPTARRSVFKLLRHFWTSNSWPEARQELGDFACWLYFGILEPSKLGGCLDPQEANGPSMVCLPNQVLMSGLDGYLSLCRTVAAAFRKKELFPALRGFAEDYEVSACFCRATDAVSAVAAVLLLIPNVPHVGDLVGVDTQDAIASAREAFVELHELLNFRLKGAKARPRRDEAAIASAFQALGALLSFDTTELQRKRGLVCTVDLPQQKVRKYVDVVTSALEQSHMSAAVEHLRGLFVNFLGVAPCLCMSLARWLAERPSSLWMLQEKAEALAAVVALLTWSNRLENVDVFLFKHNVAAEGVLVKAYSSSPHLTVLAGLFWQTVRSQSGRTDTYTGTTRLAPETPPKLRLQFQWWSKLLKLAARNKQVEFGTVCNLAYAFAARAQARMFYMQLQMGDWSTPASASHYATQDEQQAATMAFQLLEHSDNEA
ncbi:hypothetical protein AK812_SmicGene8756 [Symbiodinium microadriaticum]|uniref:Uncharacterized protein n=1 Tax=Symbiodinium microadriaticum TaxID=2951 RepID=A0A1Q9EK01_SYMMI|nr:hypothetical protein AK812_SmicGene8756 [Symbiodinium microadriaticum]